METPNKVEAAVILDAVMDALDNRNRLYDIELTTFWAKWLRTHADMLEEVQDGTDEE